MLEEESYLKPFLIALPLYCFSVFYCVENGTFIVLERKDRIKYLGVLLDETVSFRHHISYVCTRISRNNGILTKLRHFLTLSQMKQLYYNIIFPYTPLAKLIRCSYSK